MTAPVAPAVVPAARASTSSAAGRSDGAGPFASALDGALGAGRSDTDGAGAHGADAAAHQEGTAEDTGTPVEPAVPPPGGVLAPVWARLTGAATATVAQEGATRGPGGPAVGTPGAGGHAAGRGVGTAPGLAVARAAAGGVAHGLHGTQPGKAGDAADTTPVVPVVPGDAAAPVPSSAAATTGAQVGGPARAVAEGLAAAGVQAVEVESTASTWAAASVPSSSAAGPAGAVVPTTADGAPGTAASSTAGTLPVAPAGTALGGDPADTGSRPDADTGENAAAPTDAAAPCGPAAPAAPTSPVTRTEAATGAAVASPVSSQIARTVAVLRGGPDGSHTLTVVLTPETLGPVEVSVTVSQGAVELTLRGAHEHGRAALVDALPDLRRDLEAAGLTCSRLDVDRGRSDGSWSASQQSGGRSGDPGPGGRGPQQERPDGSARPWHEPADTGEGHPAARAGSGLDVKV